MEPVLSLSAETSLNTPKLIQSLWYLIKRKKKEKMTFSEYFAKLKKQFKLKRLDDINKDKILERLDGQKLPDGRHITVLYNRGQILIGKLDDF